MTREIINIDENGLVEKLRNRVRGIINKDMLHDDYVFQRFLRARNHDLDAAETMLRNHIHWRNRNKVDSVLTEYEAPEILSKYITLNRIGFDKEGCPVFYSHIGHLDTRGLLKSAMRNDISIYIMSFLEENLSEMKKMSKKLGKPVEKWSYIVNYENFSLSVATHKPSIELFAAMMSLYDLNYPERLKTAYLINAPFAFTLCWPFLKPLLSGPTMRKIHIFGKDGWQNAIYKNIDAEVIPGFLGGKLTDPDGNPLCHTLIKVGGVIPETYYMKFPSVTRIKNSKKLTVGRRSKAEVRVEVEDPASRIEWEVDVVSRDIGFSVFFEEGAFVEAKVKEMVPKQRIHADLSAESGMYLCQETGVYILEFDNTYSWMHSKEIHYNIYVVSSPSVKTYAGT